MGGEKFYIMANKRIEGYEEFWKRVSPFMGFWARGQKSDLMGLGLFLDQLGGLYCFGELSICPQHHRRSVTIKSAVVFQVFPMYRLVPYAKIEISLLLCIKLYYC